MPDYNHSVIGLEVMDGSEYVIEVPDELWTEAASRTLHYTGSELLCAVFRGYLMVLDRADQVSPEIVRMRDAQRAHLIAWLVTNPKTPDGS